MIDGKKTAWASLYVVTFKDSNATFDINNETAKICLWSIINIQILYLFFNNFFSLLVLDKTKKLFFIFNTFLVPINSQTLCLLSSNFFRSLLVILKKTNNK